jgi:hypothetical protein
MDPMSSSDCADAVSGSGIDRRSRTITPQTIARGDPAGPLDHERADPSVSNWIQKKRKAAMLPFCTCRFLMHKVLYCNAVQ